MNERPYTGDSARRGAPTREDRSVLRTLFAYEIRMLLRDRRTIVIAVILPLVLFPIVLFAMKGVTSSREERLRTITFRWSAAGEMIDSTRALVNAALTAVSADTSARNYRFVERPTPNPLAALSSGDLHVVVALERTDSLPMLRMDYRSDREISTVAADRLIGAFTFFRVHVRERALVDRGFPIDPSKLAVVDLVNVASAQKQGRAFLGVLITPLLVLLLLSGGSIVAADAISGEKERGTLETLLTTAARRIDIVDAKQLAIMAVGAGIAFINIANMIVYAALGLIQLPSSLSLSVTPGALLIVLVLFLPVNALIASVLLLVSGIARSYKEFQIYFIPLLLGCLIPAAASVLPGIRLDSAIVLVPVANISVAVKEVIVGTHNWPYLAVAFTVTTLAAVYTSRFTTRVLSTERLITANDLDRADLTGGPGLFPKRVLMWYALMWVVLFLSSLWFGDSLGLRGQVTLNLVGIFLGGSAILIWYYELDVRETLSLRPVPFSIWLAVLVGAPSAYVTGIGIGRFANTILPVPQRMIEAFGQYLLPEGMPLWQVIFFLAILPGICEEIAFRGVLLHGLRKRFSPVGVCIAVGLIFGLFHVDLFRLIPTAYLGILLAAVVMMSGSILPAILWHAINNSVALVPAYMGIEADAPPVWLYPFAILGLAVALGVIYRYRVGTSIRTRNAHVGHARVREAG